MKYKNKKKKKRDPNEILRVPKDFHFKIFESLSRDLGFSESREVNDFRPVLPMPNGILGAVRNRSLTNLRSALSGFDPRSMVNAGLTRMKSNFYARYQLHAFLRKYPEKGTDTRGRAIDKFLAVEHECKLFNSENCRSLERLSSSHPDYLSVIEMLRRDIFCLLGEKPPLQAISGLAKHGPGVANSLTLYKDGKVTSFYKWSSLPYTVSEKALPYAHEVIAADPRWYGALQDCYRRKNHIPFCDPISESNFYSWIFEICNESRTTTVPKSSEIDRTIAIEPLMNLFLQLGVDGVIRARLKKRWNIDINSQERNRELALRGSINGDLATVDMSAASDRISLKICEMLLPPLWYDLLCDLRVENTTLPDGSSHRLEKISSMGNGYTFALETVLFAALARLALKRSKCGLSELSVFGDDVIIDTRAYGDFVELLELCGFAVNKNKSFEKGYFRESCGADFLQGTWVRPVQLKKPVKNLSDLLYLHNILFMQSKLLPWSWQFTFSSTLAYLRSFIPPNVRSRILGPPSDSYDTYLFSNNGYTTSRNGRVIVRSLAPVAVKDRRKYDDFFFIKLMSSLKAYEPSVNFSKRSSPSSGNTFDITRRSRVRYRWTQRSVWKYHCSTVG